MYEFSTLGKDFLYHGTKETSTYIRVDATG